MKKMSILSLAVLFILILTACNLKEPVKFTVIFNTNGGTPIENRIVEKDSLLEEPVTELENHTLKGWFKDEGFLDQWRFNEDKVESNMTLHAQWQKDSEPIMSLDDYLENLLENEFSSSILNAYYGLDKPQDVGIIDSEVAIKFPKIADSELLEDNIFDFNDYITAANDTQAWDLVVQDAKNANESSKQPVKIKLPNRQIDILADTSNTLNGVYSIGLDGFDGLFLEGMEDTVLMIETPNVWRGGLIISNSNNVQVNNIYIDYKYSPTLTGIIESYDQEALSITMNVPENMKDSFNKLKSVEALGGTLHSFVEFSAFTNAPKENGNILIRNEGYFKSVDFIDNGENKENQIVVTFQDSYKNGFKIPRINDMVALGFSMYSNNGISIQNSQNVKIESSGIYTAPGMGLVASGSKNIYINQFHIKLKDNYLMTVTADGMHIDNSLGQVEITNSIIENTHDDALNIKSGYYYTLSSVDPTKRIINIARKTGSIPLPNPGDIIEIYGSSDFDKRARLTVESVSGTPASMQIVVKERLSGQVDWTDAVATNISHSAKLLFENNLVRNKRNRGILVQVREAIIRNNAFMNIGHGSISIHTSLDIFNEATVPDNILIENNKLINNGYLLVDALRGDISVFAYGNNGKVAPSETIQNVSIYNNFLANSANTGVSLRGVGGESVSIKHNLFYNLARIYSTSLTEAAIELENVTGISITNNYNYYTLDSETISGIIPSGLTITDTIILEGNTNLRYQSVDGEVATLYVAKIDDSDINLDGNITEWSLIGTKIDIMGSSLATGEEISYSEYNNEFDVLMAKIAYSDTGIYIAFDIKDDKLDFKTIHDFWVGDIVEIFISGYTEAPNADFMLFKEESDVIQLALSPQWQVNHYLAPSRTNSRIVSQSNSILSKLVINNHGYSGEVFIPFSLVPNIEQMSKDGIGVPIAFVFSDGDRDELNRKRLQVANVPHFVEAYKLKTVQMPLYIFKEN